VRADVDSWVLVIVRVSVEIAVTLTISEFVDVAPALAGAIVALNGAVGNRAPCPAVTTSEVPDVAGDGAVATRLLAKLALPSATS
jgi:hypothetical protein